MFTFNYIYKVVRINKVFKVKIKTYLHNAYRYPNYNIDLCIQKSGSSRSHIVSYNCLLRFYTQIKNLTYNERICIIDGNITNKLK